MKLSIISVNVAPKTSAAGKPYQNAEVIYKNLDSGKVENKNINQYSKVFKQVSEAQAGQVFAVKVEKDDKGYWQWIGFDRQLGEAAAPGNNAAPAPAARQGTWETPEERAQKQVYIIKQSSLSNAIETLSIGAKSPPTKEAVLALAQYYTDWVFGVPAQKDLFDTPNDLEVA